MSQDFLPNLFLLGAAKCGTTTLHSYLAAIPAVCMSSPKEPLFFECAFERGLDYYRERYFAHWNGESIIGEARHRNLFLPYVPERIHAVNPDARLVVIVRNPVDRAYSHWWHWYSRKHRESLPFADAIQADYARINQGITFERPEHIQAYCAELDERGQSGYRTYLDSGYYLDQIERYLNYFPREQLQVVLFDDLQHDPYAVIQTLQAFLGVQYYPAAGFAAVWANPQKSEEQVLPLVPRPVFASVTALNRRWQLTQRLPSWVVKPLRRIRKLQAVTLLSRPQVPMDAPTREWLVAHFEPHNRRLEAFLGRDLSHWT